MEINCSKRIICHRQSLTSVVNASLASIRLYLCMETGHGGIEKNCRIGYICKYRVAKPRPLADPS